MWASKLLRKQGGGRCCRGWRTLQVQCVAELLGQCGNCGRCCSCILLLLLLLNLLEGEQLLVEAQITGCQLLSLSGGCRVALLLRLL